MNVDQKDELYGRGPLVLVLSDIEAWRKLPKDERAAALRFLMESGLMDEFDHE